MKLGLLGRILIATAVVAALLVVRFVLFVGVVDGVRDSAETQGRATRTIAAAARVGGFVTDLETGRRAARARRGLTAAAAGDAAEAVGTPGRRPRLAPSLTPSAPTWRAGGADSAGGRRHARRDSRRRSRR